MMHIFQKSIRMFQKFIAPDIFIKPNTPIPENWHEDFVVYLPSLFRPRIYVELGLYQCAVFNRIIPYAEELIGVDISKEAEKYMKKSPKTRFINSTTEEFVKELQIKPIQINMLFIDADHSKEAVLKDFRNFFPFVAPHGLILLHDSHPKDKKYMVQGCCGDEI